MFVSVGFFKDFEDELVALSVKEGKQGIEDYRQEFTKGFAVSLDVTRNQIRTVFAREKARMIDVAFLLLLEKDKIHLEIFAFLTKDFVPTEEDTLTILIPLFKDFEEVIVPFNFPIEKGVDFYVHAINAGERIASDFAREGLPTEIKKRIVEISRIFRDAKSVKYYPYPYWMNV